MYFYSSSVKDNQCYDLKDVIKQLRRQHQIDDRLLLEFRRDHVLDDALSHAKKKKFHPSKQLKVYYVTIIQLCMQLGSFVMRALSWGRTLYMVHDSYCVMHA